MPSPASSTRAPNPPSCSTRERWRICPPDSPKPSNLNTCFRSADQYFAASISGQQAGHPAGSCRKNFRHAPPDNEVESLKRCERRDDTLHHSNFFHLETAFEAHSCPGSTSRVPSNVMLSAPTP